MLNTGQVCTALSRMLVPESRLHEAERLVSESVKKISVGSEPGADMGPLASLEHWRKVQSYIELGISEGAKILCGGLGKPEKLKAGFYVRPTVFSEVKNSMRIAQEEIFGPVLCLIPYASVAHAVEIANDTPYGLNSAVYAENQEHGMTIAHQIRAGLCHVNGGPLNLEAPFGGYKQSGNGRELSAIGVEEFLEIKSIQRPVT